MAKVTPKASSEAVRNVMRANRCKDTQPELLVRRALRLAGLSGYRLHWKVPGRPDIAYPGRKVAIFVQGCFWHGCPRCAIKSPRINSDYWQAKLEANRGRDQRNKKDLERAGWRVITLWECEIKNDVSSCVERVQTEIGKPIKKNRFQ